MSDIAHRRLMAQGISHPRFDTPAAVVTHLGAIQAQDYPGALWSIALRTPAATRADVEHAIVTRSIIRTWPMRGTLHFVPAPDAAWMLELMASKVIKGAAGRYRRLELDDTTFTKCRTIIGRALKREPLLSRNSLVAALQKGGISTAAQRGIHILQRLAMERMLCFGPHDGAQPTFTLFDRWITNARQLDRSESLAALATRYFTSHGPATVRDFAWWTGLTLTDARLAVQSIQASLERLVSSDTEYWLNAAGDVASDAVSRAHLLPGFDEYLLGYKDRSAALPPRFASRIVPGNNGVFLPSVVLDGQVKGTWRRTTRATATAITAEPFETMPKRDRACFAVPVQRYAGYLGSAASIDWAGHVAGPQRVR